MQEVPIDRAKEIITEPVACETHPVMAGYNRGRYQSMVKFTRLLMEAEVQTINEIEQIRTSSHDLVHLSGVHKFRYSPRPNAEELRTYWGRFWGDELLMRQVPRLKEYIIDVCEASAYRAGKARRPYGLFLSAIGCISELENPKRPWRTAEWYEQHRVARPVLAPLTEFYPFISQQPTEEHEFLLAVDALVPKALPKQIRGDICQDMIVAILTGEATLENIRDAVPRYIKYFFKQEPSKYGDLSLDTPMRNSSYKGGNQVMTLGETIAAEFST